jgi:hypothetical protein
MLEIQAVEQPCVICTQPLEVVTISRDTITGEERIERARLDHSAESCAATLRLYREEWPTACAF